MSDFEFDDSGLYSVRPLEERWPPLGAAFDSNSSENGCKSFEEKRSDKVRVRELEEEHEELNSSLLALTTHFAQVQFRLKQVVAAPTEAREKLLLALEDFAFQGCPDVRAGSQHGTGGSCTPKQDPKSLEKNLGEQKLKQDRLIGQLKQQLEEMERCVVEGASDSLDDEMSPEKLVEKQRIVLEQLKARIGLRLEGFDKMSDEDVRRNVDAALGQAFNPVKTKEELVKQLTTQIMDLERFVQFLQGEVSGSQAKTEQHFQYPCAYPIKVSEKDQRSTHKDKHKSHNSASFSRSTTSLPDMRQSDQGYVGYEYPLEISDDGDNGCCLHVPPIPNTPEQARSKRIRDASVAIIRRALAILQIFAISQFGCTGKQIQDKLLQKATTVAIPGYYDLLARLQNAIDKVASVKYALDQTEADLSSAPTSPRSPDSTKSFSRQSSRRSRTSSISSVDTAVMEERFNYSRDAELVTAVRKDLAMALRDILQHGLVRSADNRIISSKSLVACIIPTTRTSLPKRMHIWELFNEYYNFKHGREYNSTPASRLSEAFGIEVEGSSAVTGKQTLLRTLHRIKTTHEPCRRSMDAMFKSLVCSGLNQKKLVQWCGIVMRTSYLVEEHYQSWSYVIKTGMQEAMESLDRLQPFDFYLPEDLAIRHLTKINDAFGEP